MTAFDYGEFVRRNIGFVTEDEQRRLRDAKVLVIGTGGMGGAAIQSLVRCGIGHFTVADMDTFEVSNLNRQVFATLDTVGKDKAKSTGEAMLSINPEVDLRVLGPEWRGQIASLLQDHPIVINGMDDVAAGIELYRQAGIAGATVIDAYTSPLPSVIVVGPDSPRPERRLGYPSLHLPDEELNDGICAKCFQKELEYVLVHSSSVHHIDLDIALELIAGKRKRMSFAPMVITTGNLMAFETIKLILGKEGGVDERGVFFNPWTFRVERPYPAPIAWFRRTLVRRFLRKLGVGDA